MDQFTKIIEVIMGLAMAKTQSSSKQLVLTARKLIIVALIGLSSAALFCVGISMVLVDLAQKIENPFMVGSLLSGAALVTLILCLNQKNWLKTASIKEETLERAPSPIEQALALLITDIVAERQLKRTSPEKSEAPQ